MVDGRLMEVSLYSWSSPAGAADTPVTWVCTVIGTRRRSFGRLLPQLRYVLGGKLRSLAPEARSDVVGDSRNLPVEIGVAERRHRYRSLPRRQRFD
jgi:hypothetical protein